MIENGSVNSGQQRREVMKMSGLRNAIEEIERAGGVLIDNLFQGRVIEKMPKPVFTVQRRGRRSKNNGFYVADAWHSKNSRILATMAGNKGSAKTLHELTVAAEALNLSPQEILHVVHHELVHHACRLEEVQDFGPNRVYHTVAFKDMAARVGLDCSLDREGNTGYGLTEPTDDSLKLYREIALDPKQFRMYRDENAADVDTPEASVEVRTSERRKSRNGYSLSTSKNRRWTCDECGLNIRVASKLNNRTIKPCLKGCGGKMMFNDACRGCEREFAQSRSDEPCSCGFMP